MKSDKLRVALEILRRSVSTKTDAVELTGQTARATDGARWAEATLPEPISTPMTLHYSKLLSIVKILDEDDDEIEIEPDGAICRVKAATALWELNLLNVPTEPLPEFTPINTIHASGNALLEARKSLKHLVRTELSRPGLMWAWTNENQELAIGDGSRLGAHYTGIEGLELPTLALMEMWRILDFHLSEKVTFHVGEKYIRAIMRDGYFQAMLPQGPRFETDWYNKMRSFLNEDPQIIKMSRSKIMRAINEVKVTAGDSTAKAASANGSLLLASIDEEGNKSGSRIEVHGNLKEPISLKIDHLGSAIEALTDELITLKACKSVVEVSDTKGWEIIART
jgi:hypothetical protein